MFRHACLPAVALLTGVACAGDLAGPDGGRSAAAAVSLAEEVGGACHGVLNQLEQRGVVEPHLIAAAARQNAELIVALEKEHAGLKKELAGLEAQRAELTKEYGQVFEEVAKLEATIAKTEAALKDPTLSEERRKELTKALEQANTELAHIKEKYAKPLAELAGINARIAEVKAAMAAIEARIKLGGC